MPTSKSKKASAANSAANSSTNSKLLILSLVMVVNALSYGIIIPLLYPYASRFGINPLGLSILFASFSLAQFVATPIIGRLSDRFGRKPLLLFSLFGTSLSLGLFAAATTLPILFVARVLDGITGGNISVAQAMIADSTTGPERAKSFGLLGAAFGFGFLVGPALGGLLSQFGLTTPFWFAAALALVGTVAGWLFLPETLPKSARKEQRREPLFDIVALAKALFSPVVGIVLLLTLITATANNAFIIGFQSFTVDILRLSARDVGLLFALFGVMSLLMQSVGIRWLLAIFKSKKMIVVGSMVLSAGVMFLTYMTSTLPPFVGAMIAYMIVGAPLMPLVAALISERTKAEDQGAMLGINQSYLSLGQIIGPLMAGAITTFSVPGVFLLAAGLYALGAIASRWLFVPVKKADI